MADTPREKTRNKWWILGLVALVIALAVAALSLTSRGEDTGGSISMGDTTGASADTAFGPSPAVPEQAREPQ